MGLSFLNDMFGSAGQAPTWAEQGFNPSGAPAPVAAPAPASGGVNWQGGLAGLLGTNDFSKYKTTNDYGLENYVQEGRNTVNIGGKNMFVRWDDQTGGYMVQDPNDDASGAMVYKPDGSFSHHATLATDDWKKNLALFAGSALGMGAFLPGIGGAAGAGGAGGLSGGAGGFIGEGALSGIPAWDGALTAAQAAGAAGGAAGAISSPVSGGSAVGTPLGGASPGVVGGGAAAGGGGLFGGGGGLTGNPILDKILGGAASSVLGGGAGGGAGAGGGGGGWGDLLGGLIGGGADYLAQERAADKVFNYVNQAQGKIDQLYNPNSPEYQTLWDQMSAKDAAGGRNSQYGQRTVDFMGKTAATKAGYTADLAKGLSSMFGAAAGREASAGTGLATGLGSLFGGGGGSSTNSVIQNLSSIFGNNNNGTGYINPNTGGGYGGWLGAIGGNGMTSGGDQIYG